MSSGRHFTAALDHRGNGLIVNVGNDLNIC